MSGKRKPQLRVWLLSAIVLLAFGLRLVRLGAESLWYDETVSVFLAGKSLPDLIAHTAGDIHPPGYYVLLHAWTRLAGSSDWAVAFCSLFFGVLLVALAYRLGTMVFGTRAGLLAAFVVAISPYNIWYSQEVRMYTLGAVLGIGMLDAVLHLVLKPACSPKMRLRWLGLYAVCGALGLWTLYYSAFLLVAINLMVGLWWLAGVRKRRAGPGWLGWWLMAQVAVLLLYAPWIPVAWRQATEPPVPPWRTLPALSDILVETWSALSLGQSASPRAVWPVLLLFGALFLIGLLGNSARQQAAERGRDAREGSPARWLLAGYTFLPLLFIYLASFVTPLYHVRYEYTFSMPFTLLVAAGLAWVWQRWRVAAWLALAVVVAASALSIWAYHIDPLYASDDHRAAVRFLSQQWRPGDAILVDAGYAYTALETYWQGDPLTWRGRLVDKDGIAWRGVTGEGPVVVQAGSVDGATSLGWGDPESDFYSMTRAETFSALDQLFSDFNRVWVYRIYDTVTDADGMIRSWLSEHGLQFQDQVFGGESGLRVQGYVTGRDPLLGMTTRMGEKLADGSLGLLASSALPLDVEVGATLDVGLVWEVGGPPTGDAALFVGLFDGVGRRWAQTDDHPMGPQYPVEDWAVGSRVRTPLRLWVPAGTPPGTYRLEVGWYRFVEGQPMWLPWTDGHSVVLGEVSVVAPEDWQSLPIPEMAHSAKVTIGGSVQLLGFDAMDLEVYPGESVQLDALWLALKDRPEAAPAVFRLEDGAGTVIAEVASAPVGGQMPFARMAEGQFVRDPVTLDVPGGLAAGIYDLVVGRRSIDGDWLAVRRGPFPLGVNYPLATIRVLEMGNPAE